MVEDEGRWEVDRQRWLDGAMFEYSIRWVGWKEPTWEPQRNISQWLVHMYWEGRGAHLWTEHDMETLIDDDTYHPHSTHPADHHHTHSGRSLLTHV